MGIQGRRRTMGAEGRGGRLRGSVGGALASGSSVLGKPQRGAWTGWSRAITCVTCVEDDVGGERVRVLRRESLDGLGEIRGRLIAVLGILGSFNSSRVFFIIINCLAREAVASP